MSNSPESSYALEAVFPEPAELFRIDLPPLGNAKGGCDVVIDTNVLLLPYQTGKDSLDQIDRVYGQLAQEARLFIPAQVAREFSRHRATKLAALCDALADHRSKVQTPAGKEYPLLDRLDEYRELKVRERELRKLAREYQDSLTSLIISISRWGSGNDPVFGIYQKHFSESVIRSPNTPIDEVRNKLAFRYSNKIPPGYKDGGKGDDGIGDLLIWLTILEIGAERKKPLLFVTGDEKADWQHSADNRGLLPRFELVDEYRRASGQAFYLCSFSRFLQLFDAPSDVVKEVRGQEDAEREQQAARRAEADVVEVECPYCGKGTSCRLGIRSGDSATPVCTDCGGKFHAHRAADATVFVRQGGWKRDLDSAEQSSHETGVAASVTAMCPFCSAPCFFGIGRHSGASAAPVCASCGSWFHAHRRGNGSIFTRRPGGAHSGDDEHKPGAG